MKEKIRIAAGQGFWGDLPDAPVRQVEGGPIDYLMLDYLAEVTMSIMQKQKARDPSAGYAKDFVPLMRRILPACVERGIKVTANAVASALAPSTRAASPKPLQPYEGRTPIATSSTRAKPAPASDQSPTPEVGR